MFGDNVFYRLITIDWTDYHHRWTYRDLGLNVSTRRFVAGLTTGRREAEWGTTDTISKGALMSKTNRRITVLMSSVAGLGLMLASAQPVMAQSAAAQPANTSSVSEVVVTATKRQQKVREVVGSVAALSGDQLQKLGAQSLQDYILNIPGVTFNAYQPGQSQVVLRGVSTTTYLDQGQPTTGYYINEVPLTEPGFSIVTPDIDTFDLNNVEVLRGPQGTLFGSASLGGLINYVTNTANTHSYQAAVEAGVSDTEHAPQAGDEVKAMVNIPVIDDTLAVRVVGIYHKDPGYISNLANGENGTNNLATYGGRLSIVWTPTDKTKVSWMSMYQREDLGDAMFLTPGTLSHDLLVPNKQTTWINQQSIKIEQDLGFADLTAIGAYTQKREYVTFDDSIYFPGFLGGTVFPSPEDAKSTSEYGEVRLSSKPGHFIDWLIGANYFTSNKSNFGSISTNGASAYIDAHPAQFGGPNMGNILAPNNEFDRDNTLVKGDEAALFGEASAHLTPQWTLTLGGRLFKTTDNDDLINYAGALGPATNFHQNDSQTGFAPKVSLSWKPSSDFMVYGLVSQGYRFGGPNPVPPSALFHTPLTYGTDSLVNYEVGLRSDWFDHRLELDVTPYFINWTNIQVRLFRPDGFAYVLNAGDAHNYGIELTGLLHATHNIDFSTNATYLNATLTQPLLQCQGCSTVPIPAGTVLPGASRWSITNMATIRFDTEVPTTLVLTHRYISAAPQALGSDMDQGNYNTFGARFRVDIRPDLSVSLYADNINDSRGITASPFNSAFLPAAVILRPRTFGLTFDWKQ